MSEQRYWAGPAIAAAAAGMVLWIGASLLSGRREAWDSSMYWSVAYPVALMLCGGLGYAFPERPWRWALALFEGQFLGMVVRNGELGGLWPLGLVLFAIISLPGIATAQIARRLASRTTR